MAEAGITAPAVVRLGSESDAAVLATAELGGKGAMLAELIGHRIPVPPTAVVTASAYRRVAGSPRIRSLIDSGDEVDDAEVDRAFAEVDVPADVVTAIEATAAAVGEGGDIAVRSSATVEDLAGASFAGQYRTELGVPSGDSRAVMTAVRRVWASLWYRAPTAYRRAFSLDDGMAAMAVVLMKMVPATTAGVVFTVDPTTGTGARVELVEGLADTLVSGATTPRSWVVGAGDGTPLPPAARRALDLACQIEGWAGRPQDVEWAATDDGVWIVQSRPITVLAADDGFDTTVDDHELTTAGIAEIVPGVLPPLRWSINRFLLEEAFRSVLDDLGILRGSADGDPPLVRRVRGRLAIDFDQLRAVARFQPGAVRQLEEQYFGSADAGEDDGGGFAGRWARFRRELRSVLVRRQVAGAADVVIESVHRLRSRRPLLANESVEWLTAYASRLIDLAARGLAAELGVAAAGAATFDRLTALLVKYVGPDGSTMAQRLVSGVGAELHRVPHASAAVFAGPTWIELELDPPHIPAGRRSPQARRRDVWWAIERRTTQTPSWRRRRWLTGQVIDVRRRVLRRLVEESVDQIRRREATKAAFLELGGEVRRVHLEIGDRLTDRRVLERATDISLLTPAEIQSTLVGEPCVGLEELRRRRNWISRYEAEGSLPLRFRGVPDRQPEPLPHGKTLEGWAASPGRSHGRARVVRHPRVQLAEGEILVAESTDASWSPVFVRAGGVVVERGGPLSHAAILARELGIPAVLNVEGATSVLNNRLVTVDGTGGRVVIEGGPT